MNYNWMNLRCKELRKTELNEKELCVQMAQLNENIKVKLYLTWRDKIAIFTDICPR